MVIIPKRISLAFALAASVIVASAQSPVSGFMSGKGHGAAVVSYNAERYNNVFLVPKEIEGVPVFNDVKINSVSLLHQSWSRQAQF